MNETHTTPDNTTWDISTNDDGTFKASSGEEVIESKPGRSKGQFLADMDRKRPSKGEEEAVKVDVKPDVMTKPVKDALKKSSGNWENDQRSGYVAHFIPPKFNEDNTEMLEAGYWEGPTDAFVWLGLPFEGPPYSDTEEDPITGKMVPCRTFFDEKKVTQSIDGIPVKWIAWDKETQCNVYQRVK